MDQAIIDALELLSPPSDTIMETLDHLKMGMVGFAEKMDMPLTIICDLIMGREPITVEIANRLEKVLNIDAQFWVNREQIYKEKLKEILEQIK